MNTQQTVDIVDTYPLTPLQQGMLFRHLSEPGSGVDLEQVVCCFTERLNTGAFQSAWDRVASRHAVFRTTFRWENIGEPRQDVHPDAILPFVEMDWTGRSGVEQEEELERYLESVRHQRFDLAKGPGHRVMVVQLAPESFKCVWTFHPILLDVRSSRMVLDEVLSFYDALCRGEYVELPPPRPFREYVDWLQQQDWSGSADFWRETLKGTSIPSGLRFLKTVRGPKGTTSPRGLQCVAIAESVTSSLTAFSAATGVALETLVRAAWAILLSRYGGEEEVVFGTIRTGCPSGIPDVDSVVGNFSNTVPMRFSVPAGRTLASWLQELPQQESELRKHEHTPLSKIQQWSGGQGRAGVFDSLITFDTPHLDAVPRASGPSGHTREIQFHRRIGHELVLRVFGGDPLSLQCEYDQTAFDDPVISRILGHLRTLMEGMVAGSERPIGQLPVLTESERREILFEWNESQREYPGDECIHRLVEAQVARTPDAVALTCDGQSLTYRELNAEANRLARELQSLGVGPDVLVGICMERTNALVVGLLAILKAGGAYLPIDLAYPAERLAFMMADAKAPILLTHSKLAQDLPETAAKILCVDELVRRQETAADEANLSTTVHSDHLAYVIYTSGTTGQPKGSMITHRNVTRLFSATESWYHFNEQDVWSLFHSYAFDFSVWEIWGALLYGGRLVVVPFMVSRSTEAFYGLLAKERVTVLNQTPSAFRQLIQAEESVGQKELALRYVIFGGEALEMQSLRPWFERHGDQQPKLVNMYGITETTVHVTYRPLARNDLKSGSVIGVPIPDLQVYILDPERQPVPVGVPGEMYVGGAGLARGYLNRPDLTAERFVPDHLTGRSGSRLYKTGDLARFLPGRDIEYLGRMDHQVKIRGFRIELGEIESVLCEHPSVREAVVLARDDAGGGKRLIAYVVAAGPPPSVRELREHLKRKVPDYMVPAAFVPLARIPLTGNGKVDRKAMPEPESDRPDLGGDWVAPRNREEEEVCRIWGEVLGVQRISVHDDFFDLGGHSLMVLRAITAINDRFSADLQPVAMFENRTVASLCPLLGKAEPGGKPVPQPGPPPNGHHPGGGPDPVALIEARRGDRRADPGCPYRMRTSWICERLLAPLYRLGGGRIRSLLQMIILKLEGGELFTVTLRKLYASLHDLHVGDYTEGCFDLNRMQSRTRIGRYTSISPTVVLQSADHPRNTVSTHAIFYHPAFGFTKGYELPRMKVEIGNDVFIGFNAAILYPTKKIGDGAVIAAGSFVIEDVPPYAIVGGYPAKVLRYRFSKEKIDQLLRSRWWEASLEELEPVRDQFAVPLEGDRIR